VSPFPKVQQTKHPKYLKKEDEDEDAEEWIKA